MMDLWICYIRRIKIYSISFRKRNERLFTFKVAPFLYDLIFDDRITLVGGDRRFEIKVRH